jgi:hypothetical protein
LLSAICTAAARHHFQTLDFLAHGFVEDGVGQEDKPVGAGVGVVVISGFTWTEYARLSGFHRSVPTFLWAGLRSVASLEGPFLSPTSLVYMMCEIYVISLHNLV